MKEYYTAVRKDATMQFAATWMEREGLTLRGTSQSEKDKCWMISLLCGIKRNRTREQTVSNNDKSLAWGHNTGGGKKRWMRGDIDFSGLLEEECSDFAHQYRILYHYCGHIS